MEGYYSDGVTKFTDPFWNTVCKNCGHIYWGVLKDCQCPKCQSKDVFSSFSRSEAEKFRDNLKLNQS